MSRPGPVRPPGAAGPTSRVGRCSTPTPFRRAGGFPMLQPDTVRNRLLAVITTLLVVAGLKWSYPVTMPLAAALFVIAAAWPIKPWLDRALPSSLSYLGTILVLFAIFAA